jgi:hypothetical protein
MFKRGFIGWRYLFGRLITKVSINVFTKQTRRVQEAIIILLRCIKIEISR